MQLTPENDGMSPEIAHLILKLGFDQGDLDRIHDLTVKNQSGSLSASEAEELKKYRQVGLQLDLLRAKARRAVNSPMNSH